MSNYWKYSKATVDFPYMDKIDFLYLPMGILRLFILFLTIIK